MEDDSDLTPTEVNIPLQMESNVGDLVYDPLDLKSLRVPAKGIFLTGIENSDPWVDGERRDQLKEAFDFYTHYELRLKNISFLGIKWLRFGPAYSQTHKGPDNYDFSFCDKVIAKCNELEINILADMLHFGLPRWLHGDNESAPFFQNPKFPEEFARYVREFSLRYPKIIFFTLINEPYIAAFFSAKIGIWNEHKRSLWADDRDFIKAVKNIAKAAILGRKEIERIWKEEQRPGMPVFVQNESFEVSLAEHPSRQEEALRFNLRRFAALDLILGKEDERMRNYLISQGMTEEEYSWFMVNGYKGNTILGIDHYPTCVHILEEKNTINCDPLHPYQLYTLVVEYSQRYKLPLLHTETNGWPDHALSICQKTYDVIAQLRTEGYQILGMGWYGDEYQVGWHHALVGPRSREENHVGLFYRGKIQPVGILFGELAKKGFPPIGIDPAETKKEF
ncbi:MAG: family 1 glycosylhydrolase [Nanoarchaeota archaeon]|nr:family 1 glycosylhydrolase [Nanoarchaeota archaeon]